MENKCGGCQKEVDLVGNFLRISKFYEGKLIDNELVHDAECLKKRLEENGRLE